MLEFGAGLVVGFFTLPLSVMFILAALIVLDIVCCHHDYYLGGGIISLSVGVAVLWFAAGNPFAAVWGNFGGFLSLSMVYLLLGVTFLPLRWWLHVHDVRRQFQERLESWQRYENGFESSSKRRHPKPKLPRNAYPAGAKNLLCGWVLHWPFEAVAYLCGQALTEFLNQVYLRMKGILDKISNNVLGEYAQKGD